MNYKTIPMPSPAGTNHAGLFLRVPAGSGAAYDSARGLGENDDEGEDWDEKKSNHHFSDGFIKSLCSAISQMNLSPDDIEEIRRLSEELSNPGALDNNNRGYAQDGRSRRSNSNARLLSKLCPDATRIDFVY